MVKRLNSLARLYKFRVEEKQKELGFVTAMIADLELQLGKLEEIPSKKVIIYNLLGKLLPIYLWIVQSFPCCFSSKLSPKVRASNSAPTKHFRWLKWLP